MWILNKECQSKRKRKFKRLKNRVMNFTNTVNQILLVSANTEFLCDVFFHDCKYPFSCDVISNRHDITSTLIAIRAQMVDF